ncbi:MAG: hypothetical protein ACYC7D_15980 [Nitrososphaerales archaeon]
MPRSIAFIGIGLVLTTATLFAQLILLTRLFPYEYYNCSAISGGGETCTGSINPIYPLLFLVFIGGIILIFAGLFGWRFIISPLFILGMGLFGFGASQ